MPSARPTRPRRLCGCFAESPRRRRSTTPGCSRRRPTADSGAFELMSMMTGGQALVRQLKVEGIDTIFGLPGVQIDWAFDALYEERDLTRVIHTRHEQD